MVKRNYKHAATITLAATAVLFLVSYPFAHTFWGGLAASAFSAAMIGGFADWFAVTALFRRPLRIPFRTAVIPNNRERIFAAIVNMVEKELITGENIGHALAKAQLAQTIIDRLCQNGNRERLRGLALNTAGEWLANLNREETGRFLAGLCREHLEKVKLAALMGQALSWSIKKGFIDKVLDIILDECRQLAGEDYLKSIIAGIFQKAQENYSGNRIRREVALLVMENFLHLTPEKAAGLVQKELADYLTRLKDGDNASRRRIKAFLVKLAAGLRENPAYDAQIEKWKDDFLTSPRLTDVFEKLVVSCAAYLDKNPELSEKYLDMAGSELSAALTGNSELKNRLDAALINGLSRWTNSHHGEIGAMVSQYLAGWSNEKLVAYIESKVGDDLQMIRINGSVVGGLAGMALYLVTFFLGI